VAFAAAPITPRSTRPVAMDAAGSSAQFGMIEGADSGPLPGEPVLSYQVYAPDSYRPPRRSVADVPRRTLGSTALGLRVCLFLVGLCCVVGTAAAIIAVSTDDIPKAKGPVAAGRPVLVSTGSAPLAPTADPPPAAAAAAPVAAAASPGADPHAGAAESASPAPVKKKRKARPAGSAGPGAGLFTTAIGGSPPPSGPQASPILAKGATPPPNPYAGLPTVSPHPKTKK